MAFKFTASECSSAAESLKSSATKIGDKLAEFDTIIQAIFENYRSEGADQILETLNRVKARGPEFQTAIEECSKYLTDTVAPAYEKLEQNAQAQIENI